MKTILPEVSDGELRKIEMPGDKTFTLTIETHDKDTRILKLEGVEHLRCNNLLLGNVIFDVQKIEAPNLSDLARVTSMDNAVSEKGRDYLRDLGTAVEKGELTFLRLESSYGCHLDALCRSYTAG
ncbi:hypothetical protein AAFN88_20595 [Pelagibius sp. CAU 1746]|uniref:hypothetical protein n=1 Tax=Pelagibius sp. CAU 1746 TaxID=3140370 RepID=UPI00325B6E21